VYYCSDTCHACGGQGFLTGVFAAALIAAGPLGSAFTTRGVAFAAFTTAPVLRTTVNDPPTAGTMSLKNFTAPAGSESSRRAAASFNLLPRLSIVKRERFDSDLRGVGLGKVAEVPEQSARVFHGALAVCQKRYLGALYGQISAGLLEQGPAGLNGRLHAIGFQPRLKRGGSGVGRAIPGRDIRYFGIPLLAYHFDG
jgi:hypothetical protein